MPVDTVSNSEVVETIRDGLLILRDDFTVEFANRSFFRMFGVLPEDVIGRRLYELDGGRWDIPALRKRLEDVIPKQTTIEAFDIDQAFEDIGRKVIRLNARTTVRPEGGANHILLVLNDITEADDLDKELARQRRLAQGIVDTIREPLLVLDGDLQVIAASRSFFIDFRVEEKDTIGRTLCELGEGQWNIPPLLDLLARMVPGDGAVEDFEIDHDFPSIGRKQMLLNARKIFREGANTKTLLLAIEDVTERRRIEAEREAAIKHSRILLEELNHRVMNSLTIISAIISMEARNLADDEGRAAFERMHGRVLAVAHLYKILSRDGMIDRVAADRYLAGIARDVVKSLTEGAATRVDLRLEIEPIPLSTRIAVPLGLMLNEFVTNSIKYAFKLQAAGEIGISFEAQKAALLLAVTDNGRGIDKDARVDSGVGGRLVNALAQQLDGRVERESSPLGTVVRLYLPQ